ncbi:hypothetical protein EDB86DRAFT_396484 [Lactarius hatsudake]|nr:hypothetical protein EDB86DRAFT_396484 [Lactarius hatsudake]
MKLNEAALEAQALRFAWVRRWALGRTGIPRRLLQYLPLASIARHGSSTSQNVHVVFHFFSSLLMCVGIHVFLTCSVRTGLMEVREAYGSLVHSPAATPLLSSPLQLHKVPGPSTPFANDDFSPIGFTSVCVLHKELLREFTIRVGDVPQAHLYFTVPQSLPRSWHPRNQHPSAAPVNVLVFRQHRGSPTQLHLGKVI